MAGCRQEEHGSQASITQRKAAAAAAATTRHRLLELSGWANRGAVACSAGLKAPDRAEGR